ncbi:hypothetical protein [Oceanihabitans sediminis]|uniref:hypothetical protein n=1 Tax=Oceanihabitans sediminis TaxID=1812012 RepID=UPI00299D326A|nr:hypothetical protein [Oceanihabitans sediminis]MDX1278554.1 hypothetical protein [Oceanihabitans sediminis]
MAAPLVDRSTGDIIPASDHNDVKDYIEDGTYRVNTLSLDIGGTEVISSTRAISNVTTINTSGDITIGTNSGINIGSDTAKITNGSVTSRMRLEGGSSGIIEVSVGQLYFDSGNMDFEFYSGSDRTLSITNDSTGTANLTVQNSFTAGSVKNPDSNGLSFYDSSGSTEIAKLDENGNLLLLGRVLSL